MDAFRSVSVAEYSRFIVPVHVEDSNCARGECSTYFGRLPLMYNNYSIVVHWLVFEPALPRTSINMNYFSAPDSVL